MFNSMKNQFREKTGKELPKFTPQKGGLSRQSRQGSESSVCSLVLDNYSLQQQTPSQSSSSAAIIPVTTQDINAIKLNDGKVLSNKEINILSKKEEEWRHRLDKREMELNRKWEKRESDLLQELAFKSEEWRKKEHELTQDLLKHTNEVKGALKLAEEYKRKICQYQEDKDQLEGFQTQEMAKVKHLLLAKEKENSEMAASLKENLTLVESLKVEVNRLRPFEEKISNFEVGRLSRQAGEEGAERRTAEAKVAELEAKLEEEIKDKQRLSSRIVSLTEDCDNLVTELKIANNLVEAKQNENEDLLKKLEERTILEQEKEKDRVRLESELCSERELKENSDLALLAAKQESETEQKKLQDLLNDEIKKNEKLCWEVDKEKSSKDEALLRCAQFSQETDMVRQNLRQQQAETEEQLRRVTSLEETLSSKDQEIGKLKNDFSELNNQIDNLQQELESKKSQQTEQESLINNMVRLEEQLFEKNKAIRVLQQKLADMKKALQRELKVTDNGSNAEVISNHSSTVSQNISTNKTTNGDNEVNFLYLKHVIMKFLTSREYEALHLTKAVATLLKLTAEEECLLKDTIDWKMSWFRSKPRLEDYTPR